MNLLELTHVKKSFGDQVVLDDLNLTIPAGSIYGFVGKNGAGKTTTMKLILGLEKLSAGTIKIHDEPVSFGNTKTNRFTGYLPDVPEFYNYMSAADYLNLCGEIAGFTKAERAQEIPQLLAEVGLADYRKKIKGFSRGMKQRLGIAQALLTEPELLICDEPTSALDPAGRQEFLDLLAGLRGKTTILFSTHILTDVERICDHVAILNEGKIVVEAPLDELREKYATPKIEIVVGADDMPALKKLLDALQTEKVFDSYTAEFERVEIIYARENTDVMAKLMAALLSAEISPRLLQVVEPTLESIFLEVTRA